MLDCISVENMRQSDAHTIEHFVPSLELMHRAAYGVYLAWDWQGSTAIVAGSGNNGGDGFALACILREAGRDCTVFTVSQKLSADSSHYAALAKEAGIPVRPFEAGCLEGYTTIVDCLLGTGFQGTVREPYRSAVEAINRSNAYVISVDINSGMNGDTGEAELAVKSHLTVTIGYIKTGLVAENAGKYMKRLICTDIGIHLQREEYKILCPGDNPAGEQLYIRQPHWLDTRIIKSY